MVDPIKEYLKLERAANFFGKCAMGLGGAAPPPRLITAEHACRCA